MKCHADIPGWIMLLFSMVTTSLIIGCHSSLPDPQEIIDKCIAEHGGDYYQDTRIAFAFRGKQYTAERSDGQFVYTRSFTDSLGDISDRLTNDGFQRLRNGHRLDLSPADEKRFGNALNSVIYFALLPFPLHDRAVRLRNLGSTELKQEPYSRIEVTFDKAGGGKDFEDVFIYWIHQEHHTMDYLAYEFETNGGGIRFREAVNRRRVGGIVFQDYNNFKPETSEADLKDMARNFLQGMLLKISEVNIEDIRVQG